MLIQLTRTNLVNESSQDRVGILEIVNGDRSNTPITVEVLPSSPIPRLPESRSASDIEVSYSTAA